MVGGGRRTCSAPVSRQDLAFLLGHGPPRVWVNLDPSQVVRLALQALRLASQRALLAARHRRWGADPAARLVSP
jgi:hypothetical protein